MTTERQVGYYWVHRIAFRNSVRVPPEIGHWNGETWQLCGLFDEYQEHWFMVIWPDRVPEPPGQEIAHAPE